MSSTCLPTVSESFSTLFSKRTASSAGPKMIHKLARQKLARQTELHSLLEEQRILGLIRDQITAAI